MDRRSFTTRFAALAAISPIAALHAELIATERNIRDMSLKDILGRFESVKFRGFRFEDRVQRALMFGHMPDVEVVTSDAVCGSCGEGTFKYRYLRKGENDTFERDTWPSPWYCVCGFEVGARLDGPLAAIHSYGAYHD